MLRTLRACEHFLTSRELVETMLGTCAKWRLILEKERQCLAQRILILTEDRLKSNSSELYEFNENIPCATTEQFYAQFNWKYNVRQNVKSFPSPKFMQFDLHILDQFYMVILSLFMLLFTSKFLFFG